MSNAIYNDKCGENAHGKTAIVNKEEKLNKNYYYYIHLDPRWYAIMNLNYNL